jgi:hypothetical protein
VVDRQSDFGRKSRALPKPPQIAIGIRFGAFLSSVTSDFTFIGDRAEQQRVTRPTSASSKGAPQMDWLDLVRRPSSFGCLDITELIVMEVAPLVYCRCL